MNRLGRMQCSFRAPPDIVFVLQWANLIAFITDHHRGEMAPCQPGGHWATAQLHPASAMIDASLGALLVHSPRPLGALALATPLPKWPLVRWLHRNRRRVSDAI